MLVGVGGGLPSVLAHNLMGWVTMTIISPIVCYDEDTNYNHPQY